MKGNAYPLESFIQDNKVEFVIPVYQRKYDWNTDNRGKLRCLRYLFEHCDIAAGEMVILMEPRRSQLPFNSEQDANTGD